VSLFSFQELFEADLRRLKVDEILRQWAACRHEWTRDRICERCGISKRTALWASIQGWTSNVRGAAEARLDALEGRD
jgi:hypothetical protein